MIVKFKEKKITILEIPSKDDLRASGKSKTVIKVNIKYIYTCLRYFITLLKAFVQSKFNKYK